MIIVVLTTVPEDSAVLLTEKILKKKVCACVNIIKNIESFFWWDDKIDTAKECLLIVKTEEALFSKLEAEIKAHHPYEVPEIIALPAGKVNKQYFDWIKGVIDA